MLARKESIPAFHCLSDTRVRFLIDQFSGLYFTVSLAHFIYRMRSLAVPRFSYFTVPASEKIEFVYVAKMSGGLRPSFNVK